MSIILKVIVAQQYIRSLLRGDGQLPGGLVARIRGFHPRGPGSIPGLGTALVVQW